MQKKKKGDHSEDFMTFFTTSFAQKSECCVYCETFTGQSWCDTLWDQDTAQTVVASG